MVRRILGVFTREIRGLHQAAYVLAGFSILSQVLGLLRDRTFAHLFGAGPTLDAYFAAFRIPDLLFAFLTLFVSSFALVPLLSARDGQEQGTLVGNVLFIFGVVAIAVSGAIWFFLPQLVPLLFPGFPPETLAQTVLLSRIMLIQPVLLGFSSIASSMVQVLRQFLLYAVAPVLYNVGIIAGALIFYPNLGLEGLAWGVVLGAFLHLAAQAIPLMGRTHLLRLSLPSLRKSFADVALPSVPRSLALGAHQFLLLVFIGIASLSSAGGVAALSFALNLQSVPLSVIGISYAAAIFPSLALLFIARDLAGFAREVWASVRHIIFWTLPFITLIIVLRAHIVRVILGSGAFSWSDTRLTAALLALFSVSLVSQSLILIFSRAYYAAGNTKTPIIVNIAAVFSAAGASILGMQWIRDADASRYFLASLFRVTDIGGVEILMIPLAYSGVMIVTSIVFAYLFARQFGYEVRTMRTLAHSFAASVLAAAAAYGVLQILAPVLETETFFGIFAQGVGAGIIGLLVWLLVLWILKAAELREVFEVILGRQPKT